MQSNTGLFDNTDVAFQNKSQKDLRREHFFFKLISNPELVKIGSVIAEFALKIGLPLTPLFRYTVFRQFVAGESLEESRTVIDNLARKNVGCMINYGVEGEDSDEDFDDFLNENIKALKFASHYPNVKAVCIKLTGLGRFKLYEKIQAKKQLTKKENAEFDRARSRLERLCTEALNSNTSLYIDAEEYWIQEVLDKLVLDAMRKYNKDRAIVFDTIQHYRWDQLDYLDKLIQVSRKENFIPGIKLVRGAYMEKERKRAEKLGYRSPIHSDKHETDKDFNKGIELCLKNIDNVELCIATHNEYSCFKLTALMDQLNIKKDHHHVQIAQLYGMGDHITFNLVTRGYNANKYLPYGPVRKVIPYLIRRASENSSVGGQMSRELSLIKKELKRRKAAGEH